MERAQNWRENLSENQSKEQKEKGPIKSNILRDIDAIGGNMEIIIAFMVESVTNKNTNLRTEIDFMIIKRLYIGPTCGTKDTKKRIVKGPVE